MTYWEGKQFYIERMEKKYKYSYIYNYDKSDKKQCGVDSKGNKLYFPKDIICPINYIVITDNENPPDDLYTYNQISLGSNKYIYYTNENTEGEILFDLKIYDEIPYSSTESYNSLCYFIYKDAHKYCNYGKNNYDYEGISGYSQIDEELLSTLIFDNKLPDTNNIEGLNNKKVYLYKRSYSAIEENSNLKNQKLNNYNDICQSLNFIYVILMIIFIIFFSIGFCYKRKCPLITSLITLFISIMILIYKILFYKKIKSDYFSISFLDLAKMYKNYPLFYKFDFTLMIINSLIFIINLILAIILKKDEFQETENNVINDSESDMQIKKQKELEEENEINKRNNEQLMDRNKKQEEENQQLMGDNVRLLLYQRIKDEEMQTQIKQLNSEKREAYQRIGEIQSQANQRINILSLSLKNKDEELKKKLIY